MCRNPPSSSAPSPNLLAPCPKKINKRNDCTTHLRPSPCIFLKPQRDLLRTVILLRKRRGVVPLHVWDLCRGYSFSLRLVNLRVRAEVEDGGYAEVSAELLLPCGGYAGGIGAAVDEVAPEGARWRGGYGVAADVAEIVDALNIVEGRAWWLGHLESRCVWPSVRSVWGLHFHGG